MKYYCVWADYEEERVEEFLEEKDIKRFLVELLNTDHDDSYGEHLIGVFYGNQLIVKESVRQFVPKIELIKKYEGD